MRANLALYGLLGFLSLASVGLVQTEYSQSPKGPLSPALDPAYALVNVYTPEGMRSLSTAYMLQPYDQSPLDERQPLILVHGIAPDQGSYYNWGLFLQTLVNNSDIQASYKLYFFVYEPERPLSQTSAQLAVVLKDFAASHPNTKARLLGLSLGGLLLKNAMADPEVDATVDKIITIGTPFHGTPLAVPDWMRAQFKQEALWSPLRLGNRVVFNMVRNKFPHFESDYRWDNFDGAMPQEHTTRLTETIGKSETKAEALHPEKFITYSSFFNANRISEQQLTNKLQGQRWQADVLTEAFSKDLKEPLNAGVPNNTRFSLVDKHRMMAMVNQNMARLPLAYPAPEADVTPVLSTNNLEKSSVPKQDQQFSIASDTPTPRPGTNVSLPILMSFNDGVSPIVSHLWLGRYCTNLVASPDVNSQLWKALERVQKSHQARLFAGLDHRDWMEGTTRIGNGSVSDLLHPEEGSHTIFDWLVQDILSNSP